MSSRRPLRSGLMAVMELATSLVDRSSVRTRARLVAGGFIGAYALRREIAKAPGAWLFEAQDSAEKTVLIHVAGLRAAPSEAERIERSHYEHMMSAATISLLDHDPQRLVLAHGLADEIAGTRTLFWVLPWPAEFGPSLATWIDLAQVGLSLARRLAHRHAIGARDPHLSEQAIVVAPDRSRSTLIGAPLLLASDWLCHRTLPSRLAPEETMTRRAFASGDLWRLGQALRTMSAAVDSLPAPFESLLDRLSCIDPRRRVQRATEAIVELEALLATVSASTVSVSLDALILASSGESTRVEATAPLIDTNANRHEVTLLPPADVTSTLIVTPKPPRIEVRAASEAEAVISASPAAPGPGPSPDSTQRPRAPLPTPPSQVAPGSGSGSGSDPEAASNSSSTPNPPAESNFSLYSRPIVLGLLSGILAWALLHN